VAIGSTAYVVGGYDGTAGEPAVLATSDGQTFRAVATLPVPVRYPAVAALGGLLYVLGGEAVDGAQAGEPVDDVQVVDPARHAARVAGHLSRPIEGAAAAVLGGRIYLAGGDSDPAPGAGAAGTPVTVATVWRYDPRRGTAAVVSRLPVAVSHAGVAVSGSTAWLVGGETDGTVLADIQRLRLVRPR
jgi:N-acetylneuraminic acid mutarotase